jgi:hypothetical protein
VLAKHLVSPVRKPSMHYIADTAELPVVSVLLIPIELDEFGAFCRRSRTMTAHINGKNCKYSVAEKAYRIINVRMIQAASGTCDRRTKKTGMPIAHKMVKLYTYNDAQYDQPLCSNHERELSSTYRDGNQFRLLEPLGISLTRQDAQHHTNQQYQSLHTCNVTFECSIVPSSVGVGCGTYPITNEDREEYITSWRASESTSLAHPVVFVFVVFETGIRCTYKCPDC